MADVIKMARGLVLPLDAVTQTFGYLAKRGMGKTYAGRRFVEQLLTVGAQAVVIDPLGVWWGLRSSADGEKSGLPVIVLGGSHEDLPLEEHAGEVVAEFVVQERRSVVLDLSAFPSKSAERRFVLAFLETLYRRKMRQPSPLHLMVDEADLFAPQRPMGGDETLLGAMENICRRGRTGGLGVSLISQRPAVLNKNVLTQIESLLVFRVVSPQDRKAIDEWVNARGDRETRKTLFDELQRLEVGQCYFWSPGWLDVFKKVKIARCQTFDSSRTPKVGETRMEPKTLAEVDLAALEARMRETVERVKADDPRALRKRIAELEEKLSEEQPRAVAAAELLDAREAGRAAGEAAERARLADYFRGLKDSVFQWERLGRSVMSIGGELGKIVAAVDMDYSAGGAAQVVHEPDRGPEELARWRDAVRSGQSTGYEPDLSEAGDASSPDDSDGSVKRMEDAPLYGVDQASVNRDQWKLGKGERAVLSAVASRPGVTRKALTVTTGYKRATRNTYIQRLASAGLLEIAGTEIRATADGVAALGPKWKPLPRGGQALRDHYLRTLPAGEAKILRALVDAYPAAVEREVLTERTGYQRATRNTYIQRLAARGVVEAGSGPVRASAELW